jgi:hypothetical protein
MRPEELRCAKLLKSFLQSGGNCVSYEDGLDPPDTATTVEVAEQVGVDIYNEVSVRISAARVRVASSE